MIKNKELNFEMFRV